MGEGTARFWTAVFGGITAIGLVAAGVYTLLQYLDTKEKDRQTLQVQIAAIELTARQSFNNKHLELCAQAVVDASTIAGGKGENNQKYQAAKDDFWRLYWGSLGIVEGPEVAAAMIAFGQCLDKTSCERPLIFMALDLAHACRAEVSNDFQLHLPSVPHRPQPPTKGP